MNYGKNFEETSRHPVDGIFKVFVLSIFGDLEMDISHFSPFLDDWNFASFI